MKRNELQEAIVKADNIEFSEILQMCIYSCHLRAETILGPQFDKAISYLLKAKSQVDSLPSK